MDGKLSFWIQNIRDHCKMHPALWVGFFGGVVGVLVDLDHPVSFFLKVENGRFFHYPIFFLTFAVFCGLCAYIGGLLFTLVLKRRKKCIILD